MSKATLFDSRIKKYAYCDPLEIYRDIGTSPVSYTHLDVYKRQLLRFNAVANRRHSSSDFWRPLLCILFSLCSCFRIANVPSAHICLSRMILR